MNMKRLTLIFYLLLLPLTGITQEVHPDVQAAMDWELPVHDCEPPTIKQSHVTSGQDRKYKKAAKKYEKCMNKYKAGLVEDQIEMMDCAVHGLTQDQANVIMGHMKLIQSIIQPEVLLPVSAVVLDDPSVFFGTQRGH